MKSRNVLVLLVCLAVFTGPALAQVSRNQQPPATEIQQTINPQDIEPPLAPRVSEVTNNTVCWIFGLNQNTGQCESDITGSSTLVRNRAGITASLNSSGIEQGTAVTMWWVIVDPGGLFLTYAGGHVVGGEDSANFAAHILANRPVLDPAGNEVTLTDPMGAIVVLVVRSHGPAIPGFVADQISTFNGGCNPGEPNEGLCEDIQISIHFAF